MKESEVQFSMMNKGKFNFEEDKDQHARLNAVLKSMSEGIILVDNNKNIVYQNEFVTSHLFCGIGSDSLKTEVDLIAFIQKVSVSKNNNVDELLQSEDITKKLTIEYENQLKYIMLNKFSVYSETGFIGNGYLLRDITKEEEIDQLKSNLITIASHEFKTPITNIRGSVETLMRQDADWEEDFKQELLQGIHEDILHLQDLISVWFDIKKIEMGTMSLNKGYFPISQLISSTLDQLPREIAASDKVRYDEDTQSHISLLYGDKKRLQQVLLNLIMNGLVHNDSPKKQVLLTVEAGPKDVFIHVKDNGIGISKELSKKIFDRFYRVDNSPQRKTGGTGLGLSICLGLMKEHNGDILVESEPGKGSIFTMKLPINEGDHGGSYES
ncbi:sensor histidine kinase [Neobacillus vireti]|uniref:histidine kinase n=1 Tax=Neobacillus vireti LMG 21834 TaxID=1131730 RepID=A0AB94IL78_9BACI|nr:HAMP domain-containing sensor histidine kinase [Neobacillus vireti]ETI67816.1 integral membrane sensor signal transduction histidine kinase [Neobacillus vireti LMG 21834]